MELRAIPQYDHLFNDANFDKIQALKKCSLKFCLKFLGSIDTQKRYFDTIESQTKLFKVLVDSDFKISSRVLLKLDEFIERNSNCLLFHSKINYEFMHLAILNCRSDKEEGEIETRKNFLKIYYSIAGDINEKYKPKTSQNNELAFQKLYWPVIIDQFESNYFPSILSELIKSLKAFIIIEKNSELNEEMQKFLKSHGVSNHMSYILQFSETFRKSWTKNKYGFYPCEIKATDSISIFWDSISLDIENYKKEFKGGHKNFKGLKSNPLYKYSDSNYVVLDWGSFIIKLYSGMLFDFYQNTNVSRFKRFKRFDSFKSHFGKELIEKEIFMAGVKKYFNHKYHYLDFNLSEKSSPDCYYRKGKYIFIFEVKDCLIKSINKLEPDFNDIKSIIDEKVNTNEKGIGQLRNYIENVNSNTFNDEKLRRQKGLIVYPILVHNHPVLRMSGVNEYLNFELQKKLNRLNINNIETVKDLSLIHLDFFIESIYNFDIHSFDFKRIIDGYYKFKKKYRKRKDSEQYSSFDTYIDEKYPILDNSKIFKRAKENLELFNK